VSHLFNTPSLLYIQYYTYILQYVKIIYLKREQLTLKNFRRRKVNNSFSPNPKSSPQNRGRQNHGRVTPNVTMARINTTTLIFALFLVIGGCASEKRSLETDGPEDELFWSRELKEFMSVTPPPLPTPAPVEKCVLDVSRSYYAFKAPLNKALTLFVSLGFYYVQRRS
jgi:hypothetical protein